MFEIAEVIGIVAFSLSGFFVGVRNHLDLLGVLVATFLTALGGGIIRDVLVNKTPYSFTHTYPALITLLVLLLLIILKFHRRKSIENRPLFILSDSIGLVSFSISGALVGIEASFNLAGVVTTAFITAVGGGIARDVIINEVPFVLKTGFYGTISILIALLIYALEMYGLLSYVSLAIAFFVALNLRLIAYAKSWSIPLS
jgi:uncharacterized membrane protein YeiH